MCLVIACAPLLLTPIGAVAAGVCSDLVAADPGGVFALGPDRIFYVPPDNDTVDCIGADTGLLAVSSDRNGIVYALSADGTRLLAITPTSAVAASEITLSDPLPSAVDIAVTETGHVAVLVSDGGLGEGAVELVDPLSGTVSRLSPPLPSRGGEISLTNYIGVGTAVPHSIAMAPGGDLVVAQSDCGAFEIVRIAPDSVQTLRSFLEPGLATPTKLALDVLPSGDVLLISNAGDLLCYNFAAAAGWSIGNIGNASCDVDVVALGVRHVSVACGGLFDVRWDITGTIWTVGPVAGITSNVVSLTAYRGPVAPGGLLTGANSFEDPAAFAEDVYVNTNGGAGSANLVSVGPGLALHMITGATTAGASTPVGIVTETHVPRNAISFECDYRFLQSDARLMLYVNGRRACVIVPPPTAQDGSPLSNNLAHFAREISLDQLGLLGAPRLVIEIQLCQLAAQSGATATVEAYVDNLILESSGCSQILGDLNHDTLLDLCDVQYLAEHYGASETCNDLNQDGYVDAMDFAHLLQLVERDYLGDCLEPTGPRSSVPEDHTTPLGEGNLLIVAKDADWADWVYEVRLDPLECVRKFRTPDAGEWPPVYTQIRHDGHGVFNTVDFNGMVEIWKNDNDALSWNVLDLELPQPPPVPVDELAPIDMLVTRSNGLWVSYSPTIRVAEPPELSYLVHYADDGSWLDAYSDTAYTRARTLLARSVDEVWCVTVDHINFVYDLLTNLLTEPAETHAICHVDATISTSLACDQFRLNVGSAEDDVLSTYMVAAGMSSVSGMPTSTTWLPDATAITGAVDDPVTGRQYLCGFRVAGDPLPWHMEPCLAYVPAGGGTPVVLSLDCGSLDLTMPISIAIVRPAPPGDFDADHDVDLRDFTQMQRCFAGGCPYCLDDFDFTGDLAIDAADWREFEAAFAGP